MCVRHENVSRIARATLVDGAILRVVYANTQRNKGTEVRPVAERNRSHPCKFMHWF